MSVVSFPSRTAAAARKYEVGMKISYDSDSRKVTVTFRGRIVELPGAHATVDEAVWAGERYCRQHGWQPRGEKQDKVVLLRRRTA